MSYLPIITHPHDILRAQTRALSREEVLSDDMQQLAKNMVETMTQAKGVGIAAPQVAVSVAICVITHDGSDPRVVINPVVTKRSVWQEWGEEGCLSIPGVWGKVKRHAWVQVNYMDIEGDTQILRTNGFYARVLQHEIDHLRGVLFIDKAKDLKQVGNDSV